MNTFVLGLVRCWLVLTDRQGRDDRGDVPGWVLVTVMTVALVLAIWGIAEPELSRMLKSALNSVQ